MRYVVYKKYVFIKKLLSAYEKCLSISFLTFTDYMILFYLMLIGISGINAIKLHQDSFKVSKIFFVKSLNLLLCMRLSKHLP